MLYLDRNGRELQIIRKEIFQNILIKTHQNGRIVNVLDLGPRFAL
jgi:hypothetical protein